jgi:hypothetical protein
MAIAMVARNHNYPKSIARSYWHSYELSNHPNQKKYFRWNNETWAVYEKPAVEVQVAYNTAVMLYTLSNSKILMSAWGENDSATYGEFNDAGSPVPFNWWGLLKVVDGSNEIHAPISGNEISKYTHGVHANEMHIMNHIYDGFRVLQEVFEPYEEQPVIVADVLWNGKRRTGADKYPIACEQDEAPIVYYRKHPTENKIFVSALLDVNRKDLDIVFYLEDGSEQTVRLEGGYYSNVEIKL